MTVGSGGAPARVTTSRRFSTHCAARTRPPPNRSVPRRRSPRSTSLRTSTTRRIATWVMEGAACVAEKHPSRLIVLDATRSGGGAEVSTSATAERIDGSQPAGRPRCRRVPRRPYASSTRSRSAEHRRCCGGRPPIWRARCSMRWCTSRPSSSTRPARSGVRKPCVRWPGSSLHHADAVVRDLAYMRLAPWQEMIAQFFDDPALFEDLFSLRRLEVAAGSDAETTYLAAWLASRLSWSVVDRSDVPRPRRHTVAFTRR